MRLMMIGAAMAMAVAFGTPAKAQWEGAWCAWQGMTTTYCGLRSQRQCLEYIRGIGGHCAPNPYLRRGRRSY
jgi:hypothetical protein